MQDMREAVLKIYNNRKNLALTLRDTRTVVGKLENIIGVVVHFICIFFYLTIFNVRTQHSTARLAAVACGAYCHACTAAIG